MTGIVGVEITDESVSLRQQSPSSTLNNNTNPNSNDKMELNSNRKLITKIAIDFIILLCVGLPILGLYLWGAPYKRGFFCDDESLMHPFHESTVKNWLLYILGLAVPITVILLTEFIQSHVCTTKENSITKTQKICNYNVPLWLISAYNHIGVFGFGAASSQLLVDIAKYSIGRLRPHFFDVCQPIMPDNTNCSNPLHHLKYIVEFTCTNNVSTERMIKEMRLSFPSGHSSFAAFTMIYLGIYIHKRMTWNGSKLLKHFLQFLLFVLAWYTAMSRISNYKHHWSDVLAGAIIGSLSAVLVANFVSSLFVRNNQGNAVAGNDKHDVMLPTSINNGV